MVLRWAALFLALAALPAAASARTTWIAMAVALLDVAEEHCIGLAGVDEPEKARLMRDFHDYDIGGLASAISRPLNIHYEEFLREVKADRRGFCAAAPRLSLRTGYKAVTEAR